jgi:exodeoxyribonuclease VII large subunit
MPVSGELLLKLHALKAKLEGKGWFDKSRKKPLPTAPKTIGVVTSPTGAVIQDMIHVLSRRHAKFHLLLNPVKVQGDGAAQEIAMAIDHFNKYKLADVLIVGRGGGSLEDLWALMKRLSQKQSTAQKSRSSPLSDMRPIFRLLTLWPMSERRHHRLLQKL